jgi:hypothetical protein
MLQENKLHHSALTIMQQRKATKFWNRQQSTTTHQTKRRQTKATKKRGKSQRSSEKNKAKQLLYKDIMAI